MEAIWLKNYQEHIPAEIDINEYASLTDVFHQATEKYADQEAFVNLGKSITFAELDQLSRAFAAYMTQQCGMRKGDRLAIMMPNLLQYPVVLFGAMRAGLVIVNTNPLYTERELKHQLTDSGATAIVILENFAHTLAEVVSDTEVKHIVVTRIGDMFDFPKSMLINLVVKHVKKMVPAWNMPQPTLTFKEVLKQGSGLSFTDAQSSHDDIAFLQYTGGTTGVAKGAALSHGNMIANLLQAFYWAANDFEEGKEVFVTALPLYHIFALTANAMFAMRIGAKTLLITNPRDLKTFVKELGTENFSFITGVNTLFVALLNTPGFDKLDFSHLKLTLGGGMAVQKWVADKWKETTGGTLVEAYGLTETSPAACINPTDLEAYNGMIGLPICSTHVLIRDDEGKELPIGEPGELWIKGPQVMQGYWQRPEATADVLDDEGYLRTGDVAVINEDGYVKIVDRLKDMILVSGFNVYPNEVEDIIASHDKVIEAGVIGVPDETSGEIVKAYIVRNDPSLTIDELRAYCKEEMTGYKCPKVVEFVDELPKSNVGKILRRELRELHESSQA